MLINVRIALTLEKRGSFFENMVNSSLTFIQRLGNQAHNCKMVHCDDREASSRDLYWENKIHKQKMSI